MGLMSLVFARVCVIPRRSDVIWWYHNLMNVIVMIGMLNDIL